MKALTSLNSAKQYGIALRERNYPTFEGKFNAYVEVYGALSEKFLGYIDTPIKEDVTAQEIPQIQNMIEDFIKDRNFNLWNPTNF